MAKQLIPEKRRPTKLLFLLTGILLAAVFLLSFCVGKYPLTLGDIGAILTGGEVKELTRKVFFTLRLPRTLMGLMAGAGLGTAGAVYQMIFKNPLASPDIIGVSPGANLGAAVAIVAAGGAALNIAVGAFAGGLLAVGFVIFLVKATRANTTATYVLAGIVISAASKALIMMLKYFADSESRLAAVEYWTMGSFAGVTLDKVVSILPFFLLGIVGLFLLHRQVELLSLNEEECRMLGVRLQQVRLVVLLLSTLLVASVICVTGLISFVGLVAPHIARLMLRRNNTATIWMSAMVGSVVLIVSDLLARSLTAAELPISILTTFIGIPVLVYFMCKRREGRV